MKPIVNTHKKSDTKGQLGKDAAYISAINIRKSLLLIDYPLNFQSRLYRAQRYSV